MAPGSTYVAWAADGGGLAQLERALSAWFGTARLAAPARA